MPNIVIEKGGQTYRFGLNKDRSVTNGKAVPVTYDGTEYYARYGTDATPLKIEVNGKTYSVQYDAVDFNTITWERTSNAAFTESKTVFIPKGRYKITMEYHSVKTATVAVNNSGNRTITATITKNASGVFKYNLDITGIFSDYITVGSGAFKYRIERIGD